MVVGNVKGVDGLFEMQLIDVTMEFPEAWMTKLWNLRQL
jgi:hypothetical protein